MAIAALLPRRHALQTRLLAGFAAMLLLQIAGAAAVWWVTVQADKASAAAAEGAQRYATVEAALDRLTLTQLRMSEFLRTADADDRVRLRATIGELGHAMDAIRSLRPAPPLAPDSGATLTGQLDALVDAATNRRTALAEATTIVTQAQNGLTALAAAAAQAPLRAIADAAATASANSLRPFAALSRYLANETPADEDSARRGLRALSADLRAIESGATANAASLPPRVARLITTTLEHIDRLDPALTTLQQAAAARLASLARLEATNRLISDSLRATLRDITAQQQTRSQETQRARLWVRTTLAAAGLAGCLLGGVITAFFGVWITAPLRRLSEAMRCLANGQLAITVPDRARSDEIGRMAAAVQVFKDSLTRNLELQAEGDKLLAVNTELDKLARIDGLTGLANRRSFDESLAAGLRTCVRSQQPLSLIMIDVDRFKLFNDSYGHPAGDACLRSLADVIRQEARRASDLVARYGGEEIAVILPATRADHALVVAERIRLAIRRLAIPHRGNQAAIVTASFGVCTAGPATHLNPDEVVQRADQCLYAAKAAGRDRIVSGADPLPHTSMAPGEGVA